MVKTQRQKNKSKKFDKTKYTKRYNDSVAKCKLYDMFMNDFFVRKKGCLFRGEKIIEENMIIGEKTCKHFAWLYV